MNRSKDSFKLGTIEPFSHLSTEDLQTIESQATRYHVLNGENVFHHGELSHSVYIILKGVIRLVDITAEGKTIGINIFAPYDIFGLLAVLGKHPYPAQVQALTESVIVAIPGEIIRQTIQHQPTFGLHIIEILAHQLHRAHQRIKFMAGESVERRLAHSLVYFAEKFGTPTDSSILIDADISQRIIAEYIGSTAESVNRLLRQWESQGILTCERKRIDLLHIDTLRKLIS